MKSTLRLCVFLIVLTTRQACANEPQLDGVDGFIAVAMKHWETPGVAIAVVKDGKVVFTKGYGVRDVRDGAPVNTSTLFDIASCTKSFTAASVALLVDQKKLDWDDTVSRRLPSIRFSDEYMTRHATLRDLLCHRTGLQRADLLFTLNNVKGDDLLSRIELLEAEAEFRTKITYSNPMYAVLAQVVAVAAKQPWKEFVDENLFDPLAMQSTTFSIGEQQRRNFAPRHWRDKGKITSRGAPVEDDAPAAGGIYSSADDMAKWALFQLALGRVGDRQIISEKAIREMHAMQHSATIRTTPKNNPYAARFYVAGLGWFTLDYRGRKLVMHTGTWGSAVALVPEENLGVVVLSNLDWNGMSGMLMFRILDAYCAPSKTVWTIDDFKQFDSEGPGYAYRSRDRERAKLNAARAKHTEPTLAPQQYAGQYRSAFYGDLQIVLKDARLFLRNGKVTTELTHWENNVYYAHAPTSLNYDWLVQFNVIDGGVNELTLKSVGWHEPDAVFQRLAASK